MKPLSDEQLLGLYQQGDEQAFFQLVRRYESELYGFLLKLVGRPSWAEDVFQEAFLQVHLTADRFEIHRRFRPWLYTIAANKARDFLRSQGRRPAVQLTALDEETGVTQLWDNLIWESTTPQDIFEQKQQAEAVRNVVDQLPDHLREILILAYFNQFSYKEMAEVLGIPLGTVKSRLHSAIAEFARRYTELQAQTEQ